MAAFRLFLCTIVATFYFYSLINAAIVHNLISADKLANVIDNGDREESYLTFPDSIRARRSIDSDVVKVCYGTTPCGWAVYVPFTRRVDYFMKNTCNCQKVFKCVRTDDDLSVSAYVYRCRANVTAADIESPIDSASK